VDEHDFAITASFDTGGGFNATTGVATITPLSALPSLTSAVLINGCSQAGASQNTLTSCRGREFLKHHYRRHETNLANVIADNTGPGVWLGYLLGSPETLDGRPLLLDDALHCLRVRLGDWTRYPALRFGRGDTGLHERGPIHLIPDNCREGFPNLPAKRTRVACHEEA
jgi:hypothetical protein